MLTRRNLIKAMVSAVLASAGGTALWQAWLRYRGAPQDTSTVMPPILPDRTLLTSFFLLSDVHMSVAISGMADKLRRALTDITRFEVPSESIILGGDLVDGGRAEEYELLSRVFSEYKLPAVYGNMGNHEYYDIWYDEGGNWSKETAPNGKTDALARERFMRFIGYQDRPYSDVWINGIHLIMLSQETYVQERPEVGEGAWYSDAQLAWLEERMKPHASGSPAFIFIHQPLPPNGQDGGSGRLIPAKEFRRILGSYRNVFIFSGHTHRNLETEGHYVRDVAGHWFTNASVGKTRSIDPLRPPIQGLYIQVYADQVVVLGREFSDRTWIQAANWSIPLA